MTYFLDSSGTCRGKFDFHALVHPAYPEYFEISLLTLVRTVLALYLCNSYFSQLKSS